MRFFVFFVALLAVALAAPAAPESTKKETQTITLNMASPNEALEKKLLDITLRTSKTRVEEVNVIVKYGDGTPSKHYKVKNGEKI